MKKNNWKPLHPNTDYVWIGEKGNIFLGKNPPDEFMDIKIGGLPRGIPTKLPEENYDILIGGDVHKGVDLPEDNKSIRIIEDLIPDLPEHLYDWLNPEIPDWVEWIAMDSNKEIFGYNVEPKFSSIIDCKTAQWVLPSLTEREDFHLKKMDYIKLPEKVKLFPGNIPSQYSLRKRKHIILEAGKGKDRIRCTGGTTYHITQIYSNSTGDKFFVDTPGGMKEIDIRFV